MTRAERADGRLVRRATQAALAMALLGASGEARAQRGEVRDPPQAPTLPALTHKDLTYTFEYTAASIEPNPIAGAPAGQDPGRAWAWFAHGELELPLAPRKWYIGVANDVASAAIPGVGSATLLGNPELWARGVWSSVQGLSAGGGLGVVLPVARDRSDIEQEVLRVVGVVRPWDVAYFDDLTLTFRPAFDIRHVVGRATLQMRQGIDWSIKGEGDGLRYDITARATFYVGYRVHDAIGLGIEVWEVYQVTRDLPDDKRAAVAISPSVRFMLRRVQPAVSVLFPVATPLRGEVESYYALRLNVGFAFDLASLTR